MFEVLEKFRHRSKRSLEQIIAVFKGKFKNINKDRDNGESSLIITLTARCFLILIFMAASIVIIISAIRNNKAYTIDEIKHTETASNAVRIKYFELNYVFYLSCVHNFNSSGVNLTYAWKMNDSLVNGITSQNFSVNENLEEIEQISTTVFGCTISDGNRAFSSSFVRLREPLLESWLIIFGIIGLIVLSILGLMNLHNK